MMLTTGFLACLPISDFIFQICTSRSCWKYDRDRLVLEYWKKEGKKEWRKAIAKNVHILNKHDAIIDREHITQG